MPLTAAIAAEPHLRATGANLVDCASKFYFFSTALAALRLTGGSTAVLS